MGVRQCKTKEHFSTTIDNLKKMITPHKKYNVIYADPPWSYDNKKTGRDMKHGAAKKYDLMSNEDIANMPIEVITQKNCVYSSVTAGRISHVTGLGVRI
jgi:N6-adenosine-specific RNA methylase IME4